LQASSGYAVSAATEQLHAAAAIEIRRQDLELPIVVEIVDDHAACRRE